MKRIMLGIAFIVGVATYGYSADGGTYAAPRDQDGKPALTSDYAGVIYSSSQFSIALTTVGAGSFRFYGVGFSTGANSDFVRVFDATSAVQATQAGEVTRVYNVANSTVGAAPNIGGIGVGFSAVGPRPIRLKRGLCWQANTNGYNSIIVHYVADQ